MKPTLPLYPLFLWLIVLCPLAGIARQKQKPENSLLWRISGNGLTKPSWLYGTIHLVDKRVFNFGDSLYAALEACEGYALEVDPDSIMASYFRENKEEQTLLRSALSTKDFNRIKKKLQERFDEAPEKITVKEFRDYLVQSINKPGKETMNTIMDAWFYDVVRRQGKWVGGIEDIGDQQGLWDDVPITYYVEDFLNDNRGSKSSVEKMITIYLNEDLEGIEKIEDKNGLSIKDTVMLRRNRKMALRMDSLARIRSTFFAVGAAHLPGDSGVISYLRKKGFRVDPIRPSSRIAASNYRFTAKEMAWTTVAAASGNFTIQMPGEPQETGEQEGIDMKMYVDVSTDLVYMVMSLEAKAGLNLDSMVTRMVKNMNRQARTLENRTVVHDSIKGKEIITKGGDVVYRIRCFLQGRIVYMTMVGSSIDSLVRSPDTDRFFTSLVMHKSESDTSTAWSAFSSETHAFSIKFPGKPAIRKNPADKGNMIATVYSAEDPHTGAYYQCLVQDMKKGYYLNSDKAVFDKYRDVIVNEKGYKLLQYRYDTVQQHPAMRATFSGKEESATIYNEVLTLHRGNRIYYLFITTGDTTANRQGIRDFLSSFAFLPLKEKEWAMGQAPDKSFSTWTGAPITRYGDTANAMGKETWFEMYDSTAPGTYFIGKSPYAPWFWADSDTALLRRTVKNILGYNDSLLSYQLVSNGQYRGVEAVTSLPHNHNVKKIRWLIVGDTLFTLYAINTPAHLAQPNSLRFFTDWKVNYTAASTIFSSKALALLEALLSTDSATFEEASNTLEAVTFTRQDLPLLHKAMLESYRDSAKYNSVSDVLFNLIAGLKDETTAAAVKQAWNQLPAGKEYLRYKMLRLVANLGTPAAFTLTRDLLLSRPPRTGSAVELFELLQDSLHLTKPIFTDLFPLFRDSLARWEMILLSQAMLDSQYVDITAIANHKQELYQMAAIVTANKELEESIWYHQADLIRLLARLKEPAAWQWIRKFLNDPNKFLRYEAAISLAKSGQPVAAAEWQKIAADKELRISLYNDLQEMQQTTLFPKQYLTQQAMGESELYAYASEDNDVHKITFIGERVANYKGGRRKFYLYKVDMSYEEEKVIHLGIAGPYDPKPGKLVTESAATGIYWAKDYNPAAIDAHFKAFLKQQEEYESENAVEN